MTRNLIKGGYVVSMDALIGSGELDVLIDGSRIADVACGLDVDDAEPVDARGCIVLPGLVSAHMHTWQTALRGLALNWTIRCFAAPARKTAGSTSRLPMSSCTRSTI